MKNQSKNCNITDSLLVIVPGFFFLFWLMLHNSEFLQKTKTTIFHITNSFPIVAVTVFIFLYVLKEQVAKAKSQQREQDAYKFIKALKLENKELQELIDKYGLEKEKFEAIWQEIKDKINLSKLNDLPELAMSLIEKIVQIKDDYGVVFQSHITGNISALKRLDVDDLKKAIDLILTPITDNFGFIAAEDRRDINLFIREREGKIIFKVMHDYVNDPINTDRIEWNVRKILQKYGAEFDVLNEQEEDMYVLSLTMEIPKENKIRRCI